MLAERRSTRDLLRNPSQTSAHRVLVDLGLLPNYGLADTVTTLEGTLHRKETGDPAGGDPESDPTSTHRSEVRDDERSRKLAPTELAPGNSFYVNGYRHVARLDIGSPERRAWSV
ncbi:hypothetical protein OG609_05650 [Streptomyces sp. NBC_01224]|uniref:hypothetical protein n=1 Tax=Streptomyces sp. NBC_01224 TaxID=2903783 RepID=UPI002E101366|nr:hypothetical protein OG609_05650 [Streptomyces sp. NBC_01224]